MKIFLMAALVPLAACASSEGESPLPTPRTGQPTKIDNEERALDVSEDRARYCAPRILAVGSIAQAGAPAMYQASEKAYSNAAAWVTYYDASDPIENIGSVLRAQTERTQVEARRIGQEWERQSEGGAAIETILGPAVDCIAEFREIGFPPYFPGRGPDGN